MNIVFFSHPDFLAYQSMIRFVKMLRDELIARGHQVTVLSPQPFFYKLPLPKSGKKWMGYIDQYLLFPRRIREILNSSSVDTLFVFADNALGPWVPYAANRRHVIHCHDFLAQKSALGQIAENQTSWTGKIYQNFIRKGFTKGKNFISVSQKTKDDLHDFLQNPPLLSEVVYNGLNYPFSPTPVNEARLILSKIFKIDLTRGFILHIGGNLWYKNRLGVIHIYNAWRKKRVNEIIVPLILIGEYPSPALLQARADSSYKNNIHFLTGVSNENVRYSFSAASVFLFPSIAEGFGWPIAEAMACGCPVITTNESPMTEVAASAGFYISKQDINEDNNLWALKAAEKLEQIMNMTPIEREKVVTAGILNAQRFSTKNAIDKIENIYQSIIGQN